MFHSPNVLILGSWRLEPEFACLQVLQVNFDMNLLQTMN